MRKPLQAIIFDLDGVITDTAAFHFLAWKALASKLNIHLTKEFNEKLKGISRMESLELILAYGRSRHDFSDEEKLALAEEKNDHYLMLIKTITPNDILPGIKQLILECKKLNIKLGLASASKNAGLVMKRLALINDFDCIVDAKLITNGKPNPEIFLTAASLLQVEPEVCIGIEDAVAGIEAIKAAGMFAVAVGRQEMFGKADFVVESTNKLDFEEIIKQYYMN